MDIQTLADIKKSNANVPPEHKAGVDKLTMKMVQHPAYAKPYPWSIKDFEMGAPLGKGRYGRVYTARERKTHFLVAMKIMFKSEIQAEKCEKLVLREIEIQSHLKHPNILRLYTWFHDEERIYIALELASEGELYRHLQSSPNNRFTEERAARYTYQIADALNYCHLTNVIHRDLKPENIMLTADDNVKLADFGWSIHTLSNKRKTMCGTLDYLPPEMVDRKTYDNSVDRWCLGILLYEFLVGKPPFESTDSKVTYEKILRMDVDYPPHISAGAKDLISKLLQKEKENRIKLEDVMQHSWIKEKMMLPSKSIVEPIN